MSNYTFQIQDCKFEIFKTWTYKGRTIILAKIHWEEGSINFTKNCKLEEPNIVNLIQNNLTERFTVSGYLTKEEGSENSPYAGKLLEKMVLENVELCVAEKWKNPVEKQLELGTIEIDGQIYPYAR